MRHKVNTKIATGQMKFLITILFWVFTFGVLLVGKKSECWKISLSFYIFLAISMERTQRVLKLWDKFWVIFSFETYFSTWCSSCIVIVVVSYGVIGKICKKIYYQNQETHWNYHNIFWKRFNWIPWLMKFQ